MPTDIFDGLNVRFKSKRGPDFDRRVVWSIVEFELDGSPIVVELIKQAAVGRGICTRHLTCCRFVGCHVTATYRMIRSLTFM